MREDEVSTETREENTLAEGSLAERLREEAIESLSTDELFRLVYQELVRMAVAMRPMGADAPKPFDPASMISKAYLRLCGDGSVRWNSKGHFLGAAARAMRRIVIDEARSRSAAKRPPEHARIPLTELIDLQRVGESAMDVDVIRLDGLLEELAGFRPRCAEVVNLRVFAGLSIEETARALDVTPRSVNHDWLFARTWLFDRLHRSASPSEEAAGR